MFADLLARTPTMAEILPDEARIVGALRLWVVANRTGRCPIGAAGERLGGKRAGAHLHLLLEEIGACWPEPFAVSPPCCRRLSHDEALLAQMIGLAGSGHQPAFDRLLCELLPAEARERLFLSAKVLADLMAGLAREQ